MEPSCIRRGVGRFQSTHAYTHTSPRIHTHPCTNTHSTQRSETRARPYRAAIWRGTWRQFVPVRQCPSGSSLDCPISVTMRVHCPPADGGLIQHDTAWYAQTSAVALNLHERWPLPTPAFLTPKCAQSGVIIGQQPAKGRLGAWGRWYYQDCHHAPPVAGRCSLSSCSPPCALRKPSPMASN